MIQAMNQAESTKNFASYTITEGLVVSISSLENMWLQVTDQRGKIVSIADIVYFSAAYKPVQCTQTAPHGKWKKCV